jgi:signal transduction histidine kinase
MRRLTDSLLQLARLDAGQEMLRYEMTNLTALTQEGVRLIQPLAASRRLAIHCDLALVEISADADRIKQVITNLLTNAVRYNRDNGEIHIAVRMESGQALLSVADTGQGIAPVDLPHVFERFYRADKSRSTGGSGLGLSICQAIVRAHRGTLEVKSELAQGTTFTLRLPVRQPQT